MLANEARRTLAAARSWAELQTSLAAVPLVAFDTGLIEYAHRMLDRVPGEPELRVAYLSDQTLVPLSHHVAVRGAREGVRLASFHAPYEQHFQQVLDASSELAAFSPQVIVLVLSLEYLAPGIAGAYLECSPEQRGNAVSSIVEHMRSWADVATKNTDAALIVANVPRTAFPAAGIADGSLQMGESEFFARLQLELLATFRDSPRVSLFDLDLALARHGLEGIANPRLHYLARMPWHESALPAVAEELLRHLRAISGRSRKCLVLDLDNTLWGGVLGEDGIWGVRVGGGDAESKAYTDFQRTVKALQHRGVILAACSKNNPADVEELFSARPEMPLRLEDFAAVRINWEPKPGNLQSIAAELNIGVDALVFVDDSPVECAMMRELLPEVETVQLAPDPAERPALLRKTTAFDRIRLTQEDVSRQEQYRQNALRQAEMAMVGDLDGFLRSLQTRVVLEPADSRHVARAQQLFMKTNQFNLTTRRYAIAEVEAMLADPDCLLRVATVSDRFGDLGLVGIYLLRREAGGLCIDSFLMSCRAMGRGIETAMMNHLKQEAGEGSVLQAVYLPTRKNAPVRDFYDSQGFRRVADNADGSRAYCLEAPQATLREVPGVFVEWRGSVEA